jgi:hypothetical protein
MACYLHQTFFLLIRECDSNDECGIKEFSLQFNIKMAVICFPFYIFLMYALIHGNAAFVYNVSYLYLKQGHVEWI